MGQTKVTKKGKRQPLDLPIASETQTGLLRKEDFVIFSNGGSGGGTPTTGQAVSIDFGTIVSPTQQIKLDFGNII
jgi:hypothetical protein